MFRRIGKLLVGTVTRVVHTLGQVGGTIALLILVVPCALGVVWSIGDVITGVLAGFIGPIRYWREIIQVVTGEVDLVAAFKGAYLGLIMFFVKGFVLIVSAFWGCRLLGLILKLWSPKE